MEIFLERDEIPRDLLDYFGPVREDEKSDVWRISTRPYSGAHFATFPPALVEPCVLAGTSAKGACPVCGGPWEQVVEKRKAATTRPRPFSKPGNEGDRNDVGRIYEETETTTTGWRPTCDCQPTGLDPGVPVPFEPGGDEGDWRPTPRPCLVLDPFAGSGTTGMVAIKHGRDFVGIDLNGDYLRNLATERLSGIQKVLL